MNNFLRLTDSKWVAIRDILNIKLDGRAVMVKLESSELELEVEHGDGVDAVREMLGLADEPAEPSDGKWEVQ